MFNCCAEQVAQVILAWVRAQRGDGTMQATEGTVNVRADHGCKQRGKETNYLG